MVQISFLLPEELLRFADQQAAAAFKSRNAYLRELIVREYTQAGQSNAAH